MNVTKDRWIQVGGDVSPSDYGCILARVCARSGDVELLKIESTLDLCGEGEALDAGAPFFVSEAYLEASDVRCSCDGYSDCSRPYHVLCCAAICSDAVHWETPEYPSKPIGFSADALPCPSSKVRWWRKQGHAFRVADAEFRRLAKA